MHLYLPSYLSKRWRLRLQKLFSDPHTQALPKNHSLEDIFLVSFPKSGNTWVRFLVANAIKVKYQLDREVNFFSIHDIIPDAEISRNILAQGPFGRRDLPRIVKSHTGFNPHYHRVMLILRQPEDVMLSYYYFLKNYKNIPHTWSLSDFIRNPKTGITAWVRHTDSWLQPQEIGQCLKVFTYEDLKQDTAGQLGNMMSLLGLPLSADELKQAVALSSKDAMGTSEKQHMSTQIVKQHETAFVRKAGTQRGAGLSPEDKQYIEQMTQPTLTRIKEQWL